MGGSGTGVGWVVEKVKTKKQDDTKVEFRVVLMSTCTHKVANIHLEGLDRHVVTMGAISVPHWKIVALYWRHFTSCGFTWSEKASGETV